MKLRRETTIRHSVLVTLGLLAIAPCSWAQTLEITNQNPHLSVRAGEVATFKVDTVSGNPVGWSWFKDGLPLANTERLGGAHAARLSLCPVVADDAGKYTVQVTDGTNTVVSQTASLVVNVILPAFTNAPVELHINSGETASFSAGATGTPQVVYLWQRDGGAVVSGGRATGTDTPVLSIVGALAEDSGWYSLTASNADGRVSSEPARLYVHTASSLASAAGFDAGVWTTGGDALWSAQTSITRDGNALSHGPIGDNGVTYLETTVYGPGNLEFYWKVSSEGTDPLQFLVDGTRWDGISGEVDWTQRSFHLGSGSHVLRWQYSKDGSITKGLDAGFVDQVVFTPTPRVSLEKALNNSPLPLITYGNDRWFGQTLTNHDGTSAARSGYLADNQSSTVETQVGGPGWVSFTWKVSSEGYDPLLFLVDGLEWERIAGGTDWTNRTFHIPFGVHTLSWRYQKDFSNARGSDAAWLDEISYTPVGLFDLAQASDWTGTPWTGGGNGTWFGQDEYSADGTDAMQSSPISDYQSAFVDTTISGPGTLIFKWKVSSEAGSDPLRFLVNSNEWARISGEVDWAAVTNVIRPGANLLRWEYGKDHSVSRGADAGWVDEVSFVPAPSVPVAVNAPSLAWTTGGDVGWFSQMLTTHDGVASARSGDISHNQSSVLQATVTGPGSGSFFWKVSAEGSDPLIFLIDGAEAARLTGDRDWVSQPFEVPAGAHVLMWRYQKDYSVNSGQDAAWLDQFEFGGTTVLISGAVLKGSAFSLTVPSTSGQTCYLEYKTSLDDSEWEPLASAPGTGLPVVLTDPSAIGGQRFYRVRIE